MTQATPAQTPHRDRHIPDLVSLSQAAEILGVSRQAVHKMITNGRLQGALVGTTWVFRRIAVERMAPRTTDDVAQRQAATAEQIPA